jgi:hypothetical protein
MVAVFLLFIWLFASEVYIAYADKKELAKDRLPLSYKCDIFIPIGTKLVIDRDKMLDCEGQIYTKRDDISYKP